MTQIFGILNMTEDSFSDGGRYLDSEAAILHARRLSAAGAHVIDIGAASSRPDAVPVPAAVEIARLDPVLGALRRLGIAVSVDSFAPDVQRWALGQGVAYVNDVCGFPDPALYPALARSDARLIIMHSIEGKGPATRADVPAAEIMDRIEAFFTARLTALEEAGIARDRIILDPGMGFFLGTRTGASLTVLRELGRLARRFERPILVSVSRKSFLRKIAGVEIAAAGPATLAAELYAVRHGAAMIRTHDPAPLSQALRVQAALGAGD